MLCTNLKTSHFQRDPLVQTKSIAGSVTKWLRLDQFDLSNVNYHLGKENLSVLEGSTFWIVPTACVRERGGEWDRDRPPQNPRNTCLTCWGEEKSTSFNRKSEDFRIWQHLDSYNICTRYFFTESVFLYVRQRLKDIPCRVAMKLSNESIDQELR